MTRKEELEKTIDFDDAVNRIVRLEKENAELKKLKRECETSLCRAEYQYNYEQLTNAKEIISEYISILKGDTKNWKKIQEKAEQFLKETKEV